MRPRGADASYLVSGLWAVSGFMPIQPGPAPRLTQECRPFTVERTGYAACRSSTSSSRPPQHDPDLGKLPIARPAPATVARFARCESSRTGRPRMILPIATQFLLVRDLRRITEVC